MELTVAVSGSKEVAAALAAFPGKAHRACAIALNKAGKLVKEAEVAEMKSVFDNPTRYTLNSLQLTPATKSDLKATVWFKEPGRMGAHYLVPQVDGGQRKLKGFERAIGEGELVPALGAKLNQYGNVSPGQIRQILSVLGKAETSAGYSANITDRSRRRNTKERDYVVIDRRQRGNLPLGVYQRFQTGAGFGAKTKRTFLDRSKSYQRGSRKQAVRDPRTGRFVKWFGQSSVFWEGSQIQSVIRARGLRPVLLTGRTGRRVKPLLDFYGVAHRTFNQHFEPMFKATLDTFLKS
ncbi:hypothetical protein Despr_0221 [Desulfobulbus propionicus DSM 2032]|uniref:Uncharacterized protein n=1 Tax=Desulfobulbus propionicus (strain ATCC 33891 / DSM 2032 / VKM B-1956 / 1pr3) TaxID=577650 RepID=A0A7U3YJ95_DESPD|nr:hypothetical protein [Desulfobulbus propionicus]ADW16409.1 hypothetical protein Despr_0221 [Desulfobulbus propionicus DSM 2032]